MTTELEILKGIHPGFVLERKLKERKLAKGAFALSINEYPQTIGAITKGKRGMNTPLALKIEQALGLEEGFFMTLQIFYEIKEAKREVNAAFLPDLTKIDKTLFWDTDINKVDWIAQRRAIVDRVFKRGNEQERNEILRFYGRDTVKQILDLNSLEW